MYSHVSLVPFVYAYALPYFGKKPTKYTQTRVFTEIAKLTLVLRFRSEESIGLVIGPADLPIVDVSDWLS